MTILKLETEHLLIVDFDLGMAENVHVNSEDSDNRRFIPDEVFETVNEAQEAITHLITCYQRRECPFVYLVLLKNGPHIGHVQLVKIDDAWDWLSCCGTTYEERLRQRSSQCISPVHDEKTGSQRGAGNLRN